MKTPDSVPFAVGGEPPEERRSRGTAVLPQAGWFVGVAMAHGGEWVRFDCGSAPTSTIGRRVFQLNKVDCLEATQRGTDVWVAYAR